MSTWKKTAEGIIPNDRKGVCYLCGYHGQTHRHHIFGAANRRLSERDGLYVHLCPSCHGNVHADYAANVGLKRIAQVQWCRYYGKSKDDFIKEYGRNYLF